MFELRHPWKDPQGHYRAFFHRPPFAMAAGLVVPPAFLQLPSSPDTSQEELDLREITRLTVEVVGVVADSKALPRKTRKDIRRVADSASVGEKVGTLIDTVFGTQRWEPLLTVGGFVIGIALIC